MTAICKNFLDIEKDGIHNEMHKQLDPYGARQRAMAMAMAMVGGPCLLIYEWWDSFRHPKLSRIEIFGLSNGKIYFYKKTKFGDFLK